VKVILLNGPPRSGKDFAGRAICAWRANTRAAKMAKQLKERCHAAYLLMGGGVPLPHDAFEDRKDIPLTEFDGMTPRQAYIAFSENWIKPTFGKGQLGIWLFREMQARADMWHPTELTFVVTDCGFREEVAEIVRRVGKESVRLVRIHRKGYDFTNDSRSYVDLSDMGVQTDDIWNEGDASFEMRLRDLL